MEQYVYIGPNEELKGKTALIKVLGEGIYEVQFDDLKLPKTLTHGWTKFPSDYFLKVNHASSSVP
jgi:hypothetical protein